MSGRSRFRPPRRGRPRRPAALPGWARGLVVLVVLACLAATAASVRQRFDVRDQRADADQAATEALARTAVLREDLRQLEEAIAAADLRSADDLGDAQTIDHAVADLARARARIEVVRRDVARTETRVRQQQAAIDLLLACRTTLDRAARALRSRAGAGAVGAAALVLEAGRTRCQEALTMVRGHGGPVHPYDFPDPSMLTVGATTYAYGTNGPSGTVQVLSSTDLRSWKVLGQVLGSVPAWAEPGYTWAPAVVQLGDSFVLYYTVRTRGSRRQCISSAVSSKPTGPFLDLSPAPLVCQEDFGGSIDPSPYRDELGFLHLAWKSEDETKDSRSVLWTQVLAGDGRTLIGPARVLLVSDQPWEDRVIENPSMAKLGDRWVLLYSGNHWDSPGYGTGYAICAGAQGPCLRPANSIALASSATREGPGGASFFSSPTGATMLAYAAWDAGDVGYPNSRRLHVARVALFPQGLVVADL